MKLKTLKATCAAILIGGLATMAQAGSVTLTADPAADPSGDFVLGETVVLNITMDFTDEAMLGGGIDIAYNSAVLSYVGWSGFDAGLGTDPLFSSNPTNPSPGVIQGLGWGNFAGLTGPSTVGTLTFQAIGSGTSDLIPTVSVATDPFASAVTYLAFDPQPTMNGDSVNVVPLPGSVWLLGSALLGFVVIRRR